MFYKFTNLVRICSMVLCMCLGTSAQTPLEQQHINRYALLQPFVSEGILIDRSPLSLLRRPGDFDPDRFTRQQQDTADQTSFVDFYRLFAGASYQSWRFPLPADQLTAVAKSVQYGGQQPQIGQAPALEVVLAGMNFAFREISDKAFDSMYVWYDEATDRYRLGLGTYQVYDTVWLDSVPGAGFVIIDTVLSFNNAATLAGWSDVRNFLMLAPMNQMAYVLPGQPVRFRLPASLVFGSFTGFQLQVNFGDGLGFRTVQPDLTYDAYYTQGGAKYLRYRLLDQQGTLVTELAGTMRIDVGILRLGAPSVILSSAQPACNLPNPAGVGIAKAFVKYAPGHNGQLRKPYVLVEGFEAGSYDVNNNEYVEAHAYGYGDLTWAGISSGVFGPGRENLNGLTDFVDSLLNRGYDVVFVDFLTNHAVIEKNAAALVSILETLNAQLRLNGSTEHMEVMGASMGGLIGRVALRWMELAGCCHNVKLFSTYGSPHRGANIPLAVQYQLQDIKTRFGMVSSKFKEQYDFVLNSPAARQMLVHHAEPSAAAEHQQLMGLLNQLGLPTETRKMAITSGNVTGVNQRRDFTINAPFLLPGSLFTSANLEIWAPTAFPLPGIRSYRAGTTNAYFLMHAEGYVTPHSPNVPSGQLIYKGGDGLLPNLADVMDAYITYAKAVRGLYRMTKATTIAAINNLPLAPGIIATGAIKATLFSAARNFQLQSKRDNHRLRNVNGIELRVANFPTLGVDYAPGENLPTRLSLSGNGFLKLNIESALFTFVSTTSTLAITNVNLFQPVTFFFTREPKVFENFEGYSTFFENPIYDQHNAAHVLVDEYLTSQILTNQRTSVSSSRVLNASLQNQAVNVGVPNASKINFIQNADVEVGDWDVRSGSQLNFNRFQLVNYTGSPGILRSPAPNSHLVTKTLRYDCDTLRVRIHNHATMELGEVHPGNVMSVELRFRESSRLVLDSGSTLRINHRSTLIMEAGSELVVFPGANIELIGDSAMLDLRGNVILMPGATFSYTGSGFVRVFRPVGSSSTWVMGQNSRVHLEGNHPGKLLAVVVGEWFLGQPQSQVVFRNGTIFLHNQARINVHGAISTQQLVVTGNVNARHRGLVVHGQAGVDIKETRFLNGSKGLTAFMITYQHAMQLSQVQFNNNFVGLETHGKSVVLRECSGRNNDIFWKGYDIEGSSMVRDCNIRSNNMGIDVMGQHGARLNIVRSHIDSNQTAIKSFGQLTIQMNCVSVSNNQLGLYAGNKEVLLGNHAQNRFRNNATAIRIEEIDNLFLHNGYNDFTGSGMYIIGAFSGVAFNFLQTLNNSDNFYLNVLNNRMPLLGTSLPVALVDDHGNAVFAHDWTFMGSIPANCLRVNNRSFDEFLFSQISSSKSIFVNGRTRYMHEALAEAVSKVSSVEMTTGEDLEALDLFNKVFGFLRSEAVVDFTFQERVILDLSLNRMMEALSNAFRTGLLQVARAEDSAAIVAPLQWLIDELRYIEGNPEYDWHLPDDKLLMMQAHAYRSGEYYDQALSIIDEVAMMTGDSPEYQLQTDYWRCICEIERNLILGNLGADQFEQERLQCMQMMPPMRRSLLEIGMQDMTAVLRPHHGADIYPNPGGRESVLRQLSADKPLGFEVFDMLGVKLLEAKWETGESEMLLNAVSLKSGTYLVRVTFASGAVETLKWIYR